MQETGMTEEEIERSLLWKKAREMKKGGYKPNVQIIVDKIDKLQKSESCGEVICGTNDVLTQALGTEEHRGAVRGMGKYVSPHQYFYLPKTVKYCMDNEEKKWNRRFEKLESDVETLKRDCVSNVSEGASCHMSNNQDFENDPVDDLLDNSCYLAVDIASNIVGKGVITKYNISGENHEVLMETCLNGEALLPIPIEEEFTVKVKDAVGHILSWPKYLVIRCIDLEKVTAKPAAKPTTKPTAKPTVKPVPKLVKKDEKEINKEEEKVKKRQRGN